MLMDYRVYKLSRTGTLLSGRVLLPPLIAYIIIGVLYGVYAYMYSLSGYPAFYLMLTAIFAIIFAVRISRKPSDFTVEDGKITFVDHLESFAPKSSTGSEYSAQSSKKAVRGSKPVIIRVRDITAIEYYSSPIEQAFNLGHIRIDGKVFLKDSASNYVSAPKLIEISGILDFRRVCRELETAFPYAEHKGIKY